MLMTKKDIVLKISEETGFKQIVVKKVVHKVFEVMLSALYKGEKIEIRNFGVFKVKRRKPRVGRNPKTNQPVPVPERKTVVFKPGLEMKQKIR
ncbi:MAG TPA: integration host factor subunit beta [Candidatus Omnitrophica bacterium]|nr:MAG: integration host factor subunit beta [Candidatus Omnitrophota bacterium]RKY34517.1 MAG: integration host factor subunit beta [Candidatus Omnitrophota bacterium]RKY44921.1 MAG: integration host factor subunit beta [Candidatus Omnitrophota bacterium]HEC69690.1 integration host factor subunit beta [Candidatus Omnitrophota bacterium]